MMLVGWWCQVLLLLLSMVRVVECHIFLYLCNCRQYYHSDGEHPQPARDMQGQRVCTEKLTEDIHEPLALLRHPLTCIEQRLHNIRQGRTHG